MKTEKKKKEETSRREEPEESKHMHVLPFLQTLCRKKLDKQFGRFLDVLKQVHVNLPFTEVLSQIPAYSKFLKEILMKKRKIKETSMEVGEGDGRDKVGANIFVVGRPNVLIRVDKFVFPVDFIVVNMEENKKVLLILGRPFLEWK
ncbi:uncharacterized protein [Nicotiana tomentosiformis]|uniref:uncharacterized protein n=1 Tax=Nicotiana tomentosiformis TaxID=4098 RepID=UPI00388C981D